MILFAMDGCPYAQRTRALLTRLDVAFELRLIDPKNKPADFLAISPNGKVPLLVDGETKLYESFVTNHYVAEKLEWSTALSTDVGQRARQRLAMLQFDEVFVAEYFASLKTGVVPPEPRLTNLRNFLRELEQTVLGSHGSDNLLGFHCATHWLRMKWVEESRAPVMQMIEEGSPLRRWLDGSANMPAVIETAPVREKYLQDIEGFLKRAAA